MALGPVLAGAMLLAAACSSGKDNSAASGDTAPPGSSSTAPAPARSSQAAAKRPIILAFAGDVHFEGSLRARLGSPATALGPIASTLRAADFSMVNLETAITT